MIKNDYLSLKMQELSEVIAKILKLLESKNIVESHEIIDDAFKRLLGISPRVAENLSYKDLIQFSGSSEAAQSIKLIILGELLKLDGDIGKQEGDTNKSIDLYIKAFNIFIKAMSIDKDTCLEISSKSISYISNEISEYELAFDALYSLFKYSEFLGNYAKAEDTLYELLEATDTELDMVAEAITFYKKLLTKSDEELIAGNLPREEIEDALKQLK